MGNLDPTVQVAALGLVSALLSSVTIIAVARINRKAPDPVSVEDDDESEKALRERLAWNIERADAAERTIDRKEAVIQRLRHEKEELEHQLAAERAKHEAPGN